MLSVFQVADWFLSRQAMTHKKLQKLCYYAQAWYTVFNDGSLLFPEKIEAWVHGPVILELYAKYRDFRWNTIPKLPIEPIVFDDNTQEVLEAVFDLYNRYNGNELELITTKEEPWLKSRTNLGEYDLGYRTVEPSVMFEYYTKQFESVI